MPDRTASTLVESLSGKNISFQHTKYDTNPHICPHCGKVLSSLPNLTNHIREDRGKQFKKLISLWWLICASYNLSSFRFVKAKKRQDNKTIIIVFSPRKDDTTTRRQNEKSTRQQNKGERTTNTTR